MKEIQFKDRKVKVTSVHQWRTYRAIIDGIPDERFHQELLDTLPNEAISLTYTKSSHLIKPTIQTIDTHVGKREKFPPVVCITGLHSDDASKGKDGYSELTLIWFQKEFCFPIANEIIEQIQKLNWSAICSDHLWADL